MDTALSLRIARENKTALSNRETAALLEQSPLVKKLTADFTDQPLFAVFRIIGLSEIPTAARLPYTQKLTAYINSQIATAEGFSCLGGIKEIVPCYNAMLLEAYCRLGFATGEQAQAALGWIKQYQLFERNQKTAWPHQGICKHGGCLGNIPCYIGIGKTVRALITYAESTGHKDRQVEMLIDGGVAYMLRHQLYQRLSNGKPISAHITDLMMPQNYALSLTDLAYIVGKRRKSGEQNAAPLIALIMDKQIAPNQWKIDYLYTYKGYVGFESRHKASAWLSALLPIWLSS